MTERETAEQAEAFFKLCDAVLKLARWKAYLTEAQTSALASACRDLADYLDEGQGERSHRRMVPVLKRRLKPAGIDALGRQLFRMSS